MKRNKTSADNRTNRIINKSKLLKSRRVQLKLHFACDQKWQQPTIIIIIMMIISTTWIVCAKYTHHKTIKNITDTVCSFFSVHRSKLYQNVAIAFKPVEFIRIFARFSTITSKRQIEIRVYLSRLIADCDFILQSTMYKFRIYFTEEKNHRTFFLWLSYIMDFPPSGNLEQEKTTTATILYEHTNKTVLYPSNDNDDCANFIDSWISHFDSNEMHTKTLAIQSASISDEMTNVTLTT